MTKDTPDPDGIGTPIESGHRAASGIGIFDIEAVVCCGYLGVDCGPNYSAGSLVIGR